MKIDTLAATVTAALTRIANLPEGPLRLSIRRAHVDVEIRADGTDQDRLDALHLACHRLGGSEWRSEARHIAPDGRGTFTRTHVLGGVTWTVTTAIREPAVLDGLAR